MKTLRFFLICFILMTSVQAATRFSVYEANYPGVRDDNVNIDETTLVIHPRGNFFEVNIFMSVSYDFDSWFFRNYNELEYRWEFSLPKETIMHEFLLWFGEDSAMSATIMDKWTAAALFNDVSSPVRHPGLLTQSSPKGNGMVNYDLRLFPITRQEVKRYQIQYLVPARPFEGALRIWLPTAQLVARNTPPADSLRILYVYDDNPEEPAIIGSDVWSSVHHAEENTWEITLPLEADQFAEMTIPTPLAQADHYFSTFTQNDEEFYHFAVNPPAVPLEKTDRKILFVIDFNRLNTHSLDGEYLLTFLKETIHKSLDASDSINVMIAYDTILQASEDWISCSEAHVDTLFHHITRSWFPSYSYFQPLIVRAADWVNRQTGDVEVLLISNTDAISLNLSDRENLSSEILAMFNAGTKMHVMDLNNRSGLQYRGQDYGPGYRDGYYETQLQSFYGHFTNQTAGNLYYLRYNSIKTIMNAFFFEAISHFEQVEVQMTFQNGYSHSKHLTEVHEGYYPLHFPIMEVGKFTGELPVQIKVLGKLRMNKVQAEFTLTEADVTGGHPQIVTSWYGEHIQNLVRKSYDPLTVNEIIRLSTEQKILTPYTGFLIYHPDGINGFTDDDTGNPTAVEEEVTAEDTLAQLDVYPNPFNATATIQIQLPQNVPAEKMSLKIYNIMGQEVYSKNLEAGDLKGQRVTVHWQAKTETGDALPSGMYIVKLSSPAFTKTRRLMYLK